MFVFSLASRVSSAAATFFCTLAALFHLHAFHFSQVSVLF
jgi:hypothetical protein